MEPLVGLPGPFSVVYADPPWSYSDRRGGDPAWGAMTYPTMPTREIANLPVAGIAAPDCALFMWATMPLLPAAFAVFAGWGVRLRDVRLRVGEAEPEGWRHLLRHGALDKPERRALPAGKAGQTAPGGARREADCACAARAAQREARRGARQDRAPDGGRSKG